MEERQEMKPSETIKIAEEGDVILVVGLERMKLRVHSLFLRAVSKPFSAMLGLNWKKGHDMVGREGPVELSLPEDNATALWLICTIIHHLNEEVPQNLAANVVLQVAVTADKYNCVNPLIFASGNWLQPSKNEASDLMLLAATAYLFQNAQAFKEITKAMILKHDGPYLDLSCELVGSVMTWRVFCLLEEQRSIARLKLAEILMDGINDGIGMCVHRCGWTSKYAYAYLKLLKRENLWPMHLLCISEAIELAENMPDPIPEERNTSCTYEYKHAAPEYRRSRRSSLEDLNKSVGLCLQCVRSGSTESYCQILH